MIEKNNNKCSFCFRDNAVIPIMDKETLIEFFICEECNTEIILQEIKKFDNFVDNEIDYLKERNFLDK